MRRVLDTDPTTGISHVFYKDVETEEYRITAEQDVAPLLEDNKRKLIEAPRRFGDLTRVASIDLVTLNAWQKDGRDRDQKFLQRWLNDSDHRFYRTHPGTI